VLPCYTDWNLYLYNDYNLNTFIFNKYIKVPFTVSILTNQRLKWAMNAFINNLFQIHNERRNKYLTETNNKTKPKTRIYKQYIYNEKNINKNNPKKYNL